MDNERRDLPTASPFASYKKCAGKFQLELEAKRIGQSAHVESEDAASGNRIHAWLAGQKLELVESEATTAAFLKERADWQVERIFEGRAYQTLREKRLWLHLDGKPALSGRFDVVTYTNDLALVQDYKCGFSEPDAAEDNAQLRVLAVLIALNLPTVKEVIVQIVSGPYGITEARYSLAELSAAYEDIVKTLKAINAPDAPLVSGVEQCKFCSGVNICPAVKNLVKHVTKLELSALPDGSAASELLDKIKILEGLFEEIKRYYAGRMVADSTYAIPFYGMVPGNKIRKVIDWETARSRLAEYLDGKELNKAVDYSLSQLESALAKNLKLNKEQAKAKFNEILFGLIEDKENRPSLKRTSNKAELKWARDAALA